MRLLTTQNGHRGRRPKGSKASPEGTTVLLAPDESARSYAADARSEATKRRYRAAWRGFVAWCDSEGLQSLPAAPLTVAAYLAARADAGRKVASISTELSAISEAHRVTGAPSPRGGALVRETLKGIRRRLGVASSQKGALLVSELRAMTAALPDRLLGKRDRALLLLGFFGAFRRSEVVGLDVADLDFCPEGLRVTLRRSKTDQEGAGRLLGIPLANDPATCPVQAMRAWLDAATIMEGPVFREVNRHGQVGGRRLSAGTVAAVVKRSALAVGLNPRKLAGHSLRAGFATSAAKAGKNVHAIMAQTGHRSLAMVARYVRDADLFKDNAAKGLL